MTNVHPDLALVARLIPRTSISARKLAVLRRVTQLRGTPRPPKRKGVTIEDIEVPNLDGGPDTRVRLYRPADSDGPVPAMLWLHGGGLIMGTAQMDQRSNIAIVRDLGIAVASVDYRLAPENPFPAAMNDCYSALRWLHDEATALGIRSDRIAVGGSSAGGGLAAGLVQLVHDRDEAWVVFQLLIYPMLDDRTVTRTDLETSDVRVWSAASNEFGWSSYLGAKPGSNEVEPSAVPARREELSGLPPAWVGVGTIDLFHDEDVDYVSRLAAAGVECEVHVVDGAFHGFDVVSPLAGVAREFRRSYLEALRRALVADPT